MPAFQQAVALPCAPRPRKLRNRGCVAVNVLIPSEVAAAAQAEALQSSRRTFWRTYEDWLAMADSNDIDQLEFALLPHAQHVRHITLAISDAMRDPTACGLIPISLSAALVTAGWLAEPPRLSSSDRPS